MARPPEPWFRKQTGWWMTTVDGVQHKLARDAAAAQKAFYKLMAADAPPPKPAAAHSVRWLCDKYLDRTRGEKAEETFAVQLGYLRQFCRAFGSRPADALKAYEVNEWLDGRGWATSTQALAVVTVKAVFNWAVAQDYLPESPLKKLKRRKVARRERVLSAEEEGTLLAGLDGPFRDFVFVLLKTGMRPFSEAAKLTAAKIDWGGSGRC